MAFTEHISRSVIKTLTYRALILASNFAVTYWITRSINLALQVTWASFLINTLLYYFHERFWNTVHWGKKKLKARS